ncbi:hypothetical protein DICPUDRAFT_76603 [Dictyostelium purpureum]|uniref:DUSP domain-containing protein n=1 Tax=Dictyostelium purpureum TaxID=5786 RepID=F0ZE36_DICPU|nr:uncharacterized protein DICPUDRAFT_76603 [Dictyostelium purpureum]EGC37819.1 hypothetical protein DICPUDRAFT_76603 [Dictyostelium purpureum]|eukprot:XP_003285664.1 hypothetical protein DICPUDRAFT_76603 [Dictyostelium purpureum]
MSWSFNNSNNNSNNNNYNNNGDNNNNNNNGLFNFLNYGTENFFNEDLHNIDLNYTSNNIDYMDNNIDNNSDNNIDNYINENIAFIDNGKIETTTSTTTTLTPSNNIGDNSLDSILKDIPDNQLDEDQNNKIRMIKNEILSLTNSFKINNGHNDNVTNFNNNNSFVNSSNYNIDNNNVNNNNNNNNIVNNIKAPNVGENDSFGSILREVSDENLSEEQTQMIKMIKNEILSLTNSIKENNDTNSNNYNDDLTKDQIYHLKSIIKSTPKIPENEWALVNQTWFSEWEKGIFSKDELGPIDNYPLLDITSDDDPLLRCDIKEYLDFTVVPIDIWNIFKKIYGGSPDIIRKVTDKGDIDLKIPITLFFIKSSDINYCQYITKTHVFQYETFFSLKKRICKLFNLPFGDVDLFNFDGGTATQELYLFLTPRSVKLYNNQMILVKEKKHPIESDTPTTTTSTSNIDFNYFSKITPIEDSGPENQQTPIKPAITTTTTTTTTTTSTNTENKAWKKYEKRNVDLNFIYCPHYTDPFSLSFLYYSFLTSSFNYDSNTILKSEEYIQFVKTQEDYNSTLNQIQSFSFGNETSENKETNSSSDLNTPSSTSSFSSNEPSTPSSDSTYFHGFDLETIPEKVKQRPPVCKTQ